MNGPTWTVKMLISGVLENYFTVKSGDIIITETNTPHGSYTLRTLVRGTISKFPYLYYSNYALGIAHPNFMVNMR